MFLHNRKCDAKTRLRSPRFIKNFTSEWAACVLKPKQQLLSKYNNWSTNPRLVVREQGVHPSALCRRESVCGIHHHWILLEKALSLYCCCCCCCCWGSWRLNAISIVFSLQQQQEPEKERESLDVWNYSWESQRYSICNQTLVNREQGHLCCEEKRNFHLEECF
jgi:hypothetical protein